MDFFGSLALWVLEVEVGIGVGVGVEEREKKYLSLSPYLKLFHSLSIGIPGREAKLGLAPFCTTATTTTANVPITRVLNWIGFREQSAERGQAMRANLLFVDPK